ncbi:MAG: YgaP family membrane protein [Leptospirales bacterium]
MKANEGMIDRAVRVVLGLVLISLVYVGPKTPWGWIGVLPLTTGLIGFCGLYALLGFNTCPIRKEDS